MWKAMAESQLALPYPSAYQGKSVGFSEFELSHL